MNSNIIISFRILNTPYNLNEILDTLGIMGKPYEISCGKSDQSGDYYIGITCDQNDLILTEGQLLLLDHLDFEIISID